MLSPLSVMNSVRIIAGVISQT